MESFIDQEIKVGFENETLKSKSPPCPDWFIWGEQQFAVQTMLAEWNDLRRRGRMARNMSDAHTERASRKGSWGVGKFFFRVKTGDNRIFDLYYDRAPRDAADRTGKWFLLCERGNAD